METADLSVENITTYLLPIIVSNCSLYETTVAAHERTAKIEKVAVYAASAPKTAGRARRTN
jgi:hypothetical protein